MGDKLAAALEFIGQIIKSEISFFSFSRIAPPWYTFRFWQGTLGNSFALIAPFFIGL